MISKFDSRGGSVVLYFELQIPRGSESVLQHTISSGEVLFVLGANGTGKSSLMYHLYKAHQLNALRISAHRQTWFSSGDLALSPQQKRQSESQIRSSDTRSDSRWIDRLGESRANIAIFDLIAAENVRARKIADAMAEGRIDIANALLGKESPISAINELMHLSQLPIFVSVDEGERVLARRSGSAPYSIAELSDGERNALLIAASVLTARAGTLLLIDEPERHLHRSIISPLLTLLFAKRIDCSFVISTHEVMLPLDNPNSRSLLLRSCTYPQGGKCHWDADLMPSEGKIDEELKKDILGARRKIVFIEGNEASLDKSLYSLVFPNVTIVPKASCREVEKAVLGIRGADNFHWISAFGIIDNDGRSKEEVERLKARSVYAISMFSVESIYYHPEVQRAVTKRHARVTGENADARVEEAKTKAIRDIAPHAQRLSERAAERLLRENTLKFLPGKSEIAAGKKLNFTLDIPNVLEVEREMFNKAISECNLYLLVARYPVRETPALKTIAATLGFKDRTQYESAVRQLLKDDSEVLNSVRSMFGTLTSDIGLD